MSVEVKFQAESPDTGFCKTYTDDVTKWPDGVYQRPGWRDRIVVLDNSVVTILGSGAIYSQYAGLGENRTSEDWVRISDTPRIASITFAGSMNYPDGKPKGGES